MGSASAYSVPIVDVRRAVVLPGAGISLEAPSSLPSGDELALRLFDLVAGGRSYPFAAGAIAQLRREIRSGDLRLEVICDLLGADLSPRDVVSVFGLLRGAVPNRLHLALAILQPRAIVTPNQDRLLEDAAALVSSTIRPIHLHGRCDRPSSIVTTVTDYVHGLSRRKSRTVQRVVEGQDLVVVGYSGRDLDVMGALLKCNPRSVIWIEHGARSRDSDLPSELLAAERQFASIWTRVGAPTADWLFDQLATTEQAIVKRVLGGLPARRHPSRASVEARIAARFARLDGVARALAVGRVLRHAGYPDEARAGYQALRRRHSRDARVQLAWAEATFEMNEFERAIPVFRKIGNNGATPYLRAQALLGEVEALRDVSRYNQARATLRRLPGVVGLITEKGPRARTAAATACQLAGVARMDGELDVAEAAYRDAERESVVAGDARNALESRTWRTEIILARGRYTEALQESSETLEYAPLTNTRWLTWAKFVHGEALGAAGETWHALQMLKEALSEFVPYGNEMGEAWSLLTEAMFLRADDPLGAGHSVDAAEDAIRRYGSSLIYAQARLYWEQAEVARARGDLVAAARELSRYRAHIRRHFPAGHLWLGAHGEALALELMRERGNRATAAVRARRVQAAYAAIGADGAARRMALSEWLATNMTAPALPPFLKNWEKRQYTLELAALRVFTSRGYLPIQHWFVP